MRRIAFNSSLEATKLYFFAYQYCRNRKCTQPRTNRVAPDFNPQWFVETDITDDELTYFKLVGID